MFETKPTTVAAVVVLKTGEKLSVQLNADLKFFPTSFTESYLLSFPSGEGTNYFVQGNNIAYIKARVN